MPSWERHSSPLPSSRSWPCGLRVALRTLEEPPCRSEPSERLRHGPLPQPKLRKNGLRVLRRASRVQHQVLLSGERAVFVASFSPVAGAGPETGVGSETGFGSEAAKGLEVEVTCGA